MTSRERWEEGHVARDVSVRNMEKSIESHILSLEGAFRDLYQSANFNDERFVRIPSGSVYRIKLEIEKFEPIKSIGLGALRTGQGELL